MLRKVKKVEKRRESEGGTVRGEGEGRGHHAESMGGLGHVGSHRAECSVVTGAGADVVVGSALRPRLWVGVDAFHDCLL